MLQRLNNSGAIYAMYTVVSSDSDSSNILDSSNSDSSDSSSRDSSDSESHFGDPARWQNVFSKPVRWRA